MFAEQRVEQILQRLHQRGTLTVDEVADEFGVSPDTIRRDFNRLSRQAAVRRTHGGILLQSGERETQSLTERAVRNPAEKLAIARAAAGLVEDHETIVIDAGSTTALMVDAISAQDVTVITYSVEIAWRALQRDNLKVYLAGGMVRASTAAAVGDDTLQVISRLSASRAFLGANGIHPTQGLMTPNYLEASVKRALMDISQQNVLLVDASKAGRSALVRFGEVRDIDLLITDSGMQESFLQELRPLVGSIRVVEAGSQV